MKKAIKIIFIVFGILGIAVSACAFYAVATTANYKLDKEKLINTEYNVEFYDAFGSEISSFTGKTKTAALEDLPAYVKNAFIAVEDKRFYKHNGIDKKAMMRAALHNIKTFSFKEGGSTISQQLIKNTHLNNEKTIKRKLAEWKLTKKLEKNYSKDEILEMYLNTIYFGENSFGITNAANTYFGKRPENISIDEAALLAGVIKAPSTYSPLKNAEKAKNRRDTVLKLMCEQGYITEKEYKENSAKSITIAPEKHENYAEFYLKHANAEFEELINFSPYNVKNCKVYTYFNPEMQKNIFKNANDTENGNCTSIVIDNKTHGVAAYYSQGIDDRRQTGSALKPLAVYAPAIEENIVSECTPILDEKTDFGGYSPSNYGDKYCGYISVKNSLENSSNVCAVKILNYLGCKNAVDYLKKMNFTVDNGDKNLSLALGATAQGATLKELASAYTVFTNGGAYSTSNFIDKIEVQGKVVYKNTPQKTQVFSEETCDIMNYMLQGVANDGTAKKLGVLNRAIAAKTGTVGNEKGNSDAYTVSFNPDYTVGVRLSGKLDNSVTGGGLPAVKAYNFWKSLNSFPEFPCPKKTKLDLIAYEQEHKLVLADDNAPARYVTEGLFKKSNLPKEKSTRFTSPKIETPILTVNNNKIEIKLCQTEYIEFLIYREVDSKKSLAYDSKGKSEKYEYAEEMTKCGKLYSYYVIPYTDFNGKQFKGEEICLGKIKCPEIDLGDWWED